MSIRVLPFMCLFRYVVYVNKGLKYHLRVILKLMNAIPKQEGQDGPGSLTWNFEMTIAKYFLALSEEFTRISVCL